MKNKFIIFGFLGLIILIAVLTNPSPERHKETIKSKLNNYLQKSLKESTKETNNEWEQAGQALGLMLGGAIIDRIIDNTVTTNNYILFSTTQISWEGKTNTIGIGVFGNVYLTGKLDEALNEGLLKNIN